MRNHLSVIHTALYNVRKRNKDESADRSINNIEKKIFEINDQIKHLSDYRVIGNLQCEAINLYEILDSCIQDIKTKAGKDIMFSNECTYLNECKIVADLAQIKLLFENILSSAVKSLDGEKGKIVLSCKKNKTSLQISCQNDGLGISENCIDQCWVSSLTNKEKKIGLDLFLCKQIIKTYKGRIKIANNKKGVKITVIIPIKEKED